MALIKKALIRTFSSADWNYSKDTPEEDIKRSYLELANIVTQMEDDNIFIEEVFDLYFGKSLDNLLKQTAGRGKKVKNSKHVTSMISQATGIHGTLQEYVLELINNELPHKGPSSKMINSGKSG
jgi:hypothetical protein